LPRILAGAPDAQAVCLVQAKFLARARALVEQMRLGSPALARRVRLVMGDITEPDLGLALELKSLAGDISAIWHLAAVYDLSVPRDVAFRVNVEGTRNVLGLAARCGDLDRLHYVSTCYVSGRHAGIFSEDDLEVRQEFNNFYEESKFLAEVEVRSAMRQGLRATVYRPSIVVGDSRTGATGKYDGPYFVLRWMLRQRGTAVVPVVGDPDATRVNLVPLDFVIDALMHLSALPHAVGRTYQLADPSPLTVSELLDVFGAAMEKRVRRLPVPRRTAKWAIDRVPGVYRLLKIPSAAVDYFAHPTHYSVFQTRADLEGSGIEVPPFPSYAGRLVSFLRSHPKVGSGAQP
jgi:thioester reductase-like protein